MPYRRAPWSWFHIDQRTWLIIQACVPVVLVAVIIGLILLKVDTQSGLRQTAQEGRRQAAVLSCEAIRDSNEDFVTFLDKATASNPDPERRAETKIFLVQLRESNADTFGNCLTNAHKIK